MMDEIETTDNNDLTDINFVVTAHGSTVYDLHTGIQYVYKLDKRMNPNVFIKGLNAGEVFEPFYTGAEAVEFWDKLRRRINMDY